MFPQLQQRIKDALAKLQQQLVSHVFHCHHLCFTDDSKEQDQDGQTSSADIEKAKEAVAGALKALKETS